MTDDPWKVLELDGGTATLADVKRSYARLLKVTRPDRDPEGFMRLRSAYENAQALLRGESPPSMMPAQASDGKPPAPAEPVPTQPRITTAVREIPEAVNAAVKELRAAIVSRVRQKVRIAWAAYDEAVEKHDLSADGRWLIFMERIEYHCHDIGVPKCALFGRISNAVECEKRLASRASHGQTNRKISPGAPTLQECPTWRSVALLAERGTLRTQ